MPLRVGIDLLDVEEVEEALSAHGERYLARVFTPREVEDCRADGAPAPARLAARFAAKEAAVKVLRPGAVALPWTSIEVERAPGGAPGLRLAGAAAALAGDAALGPLALSFTHTHTRGLAAAIVVAETPASR